MTRVKYLKQKEKNYETRDEITAGEPLHFAVPVTFSNNGLSEICDLYRWRRIIYCLDYCGFSFFISLPHSSC